MKTKEIVFVVVSTSLILAQFIGLIVTENPIYWGTLVITTSVSFALATELDEKFK